MTPAELHTAALAKIAERRAVSAAGTPGPWEADPERGYVWAPGNRDRVCRTSAYRWAQDSSLIVAAVNAFDRDTDALESVLNVFHAPGSPLESGALRCRGDHLMPVQAWPCLEAKSALRALGVLDD